MAIQKVEIGDCREIIKKYPDNFFDTLVTSPPYYHMRNYRTPPLTYGGRLDCNHHWVEKIQKLEGGTATETTTVGANKESEANNRGGEGIKYWMCQCGAFKGEIGWEPTPELFIRDLVEVFEIIRPKIKETGSIWVNLGDKWIDLDQQLIPEQFALGMKKKGWTLINKITWVKGNSMPESVKRRLSKTSELIFHFVKNHNYFYNLDAIRKPNKPQSLERYQRAVNLGSFAVDTKYSDKRLMGMPIHPPKWFTGANTGVNNKVPYKDNNPHRTRLSEIKDANYMGKNPGDTWEINTQSYSGAHFGVFPLSLVRIPILATCPPYICKKCSKPRERIMETITVDRTATDGKGNGELADGSFGSSIQRLAGWSDCGCGAEYDAGWVLDPFAGSGTTLEFCRKENRNCVGIELNYNYKNLCIRRAKLDEPTVKPIRRIEIL